MIEGVNASISTASAVRAVAQQVSSAESLSANPSRVQKAAIGTAYSSKYVELAPDIKPIFIVRDSDTGESIRQFPTESQIRAYQRAQQSRDAATQASTVKVSRQSVSTEEATQLVKSSVEFKEVRKEIKKVDAPPPPLPGQTKTEVNVGGDTGAEVKAQVKTSFSTDV
jgi:hypothetical protein